jgi:hypothetical protein
MIDHAARVETRRAINDFLSDRASAFNCDCRLLVIRDSTNDCTVHAVIDLLWYFYDDLVDHAAVLTKTEWNAIQRIAILLDSTAEARWKTSRKSHVSQLVAGAMIVALSVTALFVGWWVALMLLVVTSPCAALLMVWRESAYERLFPMQVPEIWPYDSLGSLRFSRRLAPGFRKRRFRREIVGRRIRSDTSEAFGQIQFLVAACLGSLAYYITYCFPLQTVTISVSRQTSTISSAA